MERTDLKRYMEVVYGRCCRILGDSDAAWDALQDVFASFYEARKERKITEPLAYLYRSSTNHCLNVLRSKKKTLPLLLEFLDSGEDSGKRVESRLMVEALLEVIGQESMDLLVYRHVDHMTYEEIAALYGMSDRGIKKRLDRLETKIRKHFQGRK